MKSNYNFNSGDSIYFFIIPATREYYYSAYIKNYKASKNMYKNYTDKFYTAINKNNIYIIPYKFN